MLCGDGAMSSNTAAMSCNIAAMLGNGALVLDDATTMLRCRAPSLHRARLMMECKAVMLCRDGVMLQCARVMVRCAGADLFSGLRIPSVDPADGAQARARLAGITSAHAQHDAARHDDVDQPLRRRKLPRQRPGAAADAAPHSTAAHVVDAERAGVLRGEAFAGATVSGWCGA
jgi:hypothetical protein